MSTTKRQRKSVLSYAMESAIQQAVETAMKQVSSTATTPKRVSTRKHVSTTLSDKKPTERSKQKTQSVQETMFSSGEYSSFKTTFLFGVEKKADGSLYEVRLQWNPPKSVEWSCNCGAAYGILSRNHCKHIQAIHHSMTPPSQSVQPTEATTTTSSSSSKVNEEEMMFLESSMKEL